MGYARHLMFSRCLSSVRVRQVVAPDQKFNFSIAFCALHKHIVAVRRRELLHMPSLGVSSLDLGRLLQNGWLFFCSLVILLCACGMSIG